MSPWFHQGGCRTAHKTAVHKDTFITTGTGRPAVRTDRTAADKSDILMSAITALTTSWWEFVFS